MSTAKIEIKAIVGLGNPGAKYARTRHNFGFLVVDSVASLQGATWRTKGEAEIAEIIVADKKILLVKPQTFMNSSGRIFSLLTKQGIKPEQILVIHDELDFPLGRNAFRFGGSARGHNGLKSIIAMIGSDFHRLRCGIGRPERKEDVPDYVLASFAESSEIVEKSIAEAAEMLADFITTKN